MVNVLENVKEKCEKALFKNKRKDIKTKIYTKFIYPCYKEDELINQLDSHDYNIISVKEKEDKDTTLIELELNTYSEKETNHVMDELYQYKILKLVMENN